MLRTATTSTALVTLALIASGGSAQAAQPLTTAKVVECVRAGTVSEPEAIFKGTMRRVGGTDHMAMRLTLQERVGPAVWTAIKAPGLGVWRPSHIGVRVFAYSQRVLPLADASSYRVAIAYRWYDAAGNVVRRATRKSPPCLPLDRRSVPKAKVVRVRQGSNVPNAVDAALPSGE
jgi:hypothetical protein